MEQTDLNNFGRGPPEEQSYQVQLKSMVEMSFEVFSIFSSGGHFVQQSGMIWTMLVVDLPSNNPINFGWNPPGGYKGDVIWSLFYF